MRVLLFLLLTLESFALRSHFIGPGSTRSTPPAIGHSHQRLPVSFMDSLHDPITIRPLYSSYGGDEGGGSLKNLGVILFLGLGVFGTGFVSTLSGIGKDMAIEAKRSAANSVQQSTPKNGASTTSSPSSSSSSSSRGTLTKLSRREINAKLAQVPVFFVKNAKGGVYTADGQGKLFETRAGAEAFASKVLGNSEETGAATMDEVFYPLIKKSQKLSVSGPIAANSEAGASYVLVGDPTEVEKAGGDAFTSKHPAGDFPLTRVPKLAFNADGGSSSSSSIQFPLFTERASAEGAYARLQDSTQTADEKKKGAKEDAALFQVAGLLDIVELWSTGGSEGRTLEIYPSMTEIDNYKSLR